MVGAGVVCGHLGIPLGDNASNGIQGTKCTLPGCYSPDRAFAGARNEEDRTRARKEN